MRNPLRRFFFPSFNDGSVPEVTKPCQAEEGFDDATACSNWRHG